MRKKTSIFLQSRDCRNKLYFLKDLESKSSVAELSKNYTSDFFGEEREDLVKNANPACISLAWSADGGTLFSGYTDNVIRVWEA